MVITKIEIENFLGIKSLKKELTSSIVKTAELSSDEDERDDAISALMFIFNKSKIPTLELINKDYYNIENENVTKLFVRMEYFNGNNKETHSLCKEIIYKKVSDKVRATAYYYIDDEGVKFEKYDAKAKRLFLCAWIL